MKIEAVCEYNQNGWLIYAANYPGAYVRGASKNEALAKFPGELRSYLRWARKIAEFEGVDIEIVQEKISELQICDADSDILFDAERAPLSTEEYDVLRSLALRSARDFRSLYESIPNPDISHRPARRSFYGAVPRTPREMYEHTNKVTAYYAAAFGIELENLPDIYANRMQMLAELEGLEDFCSDRVYTAPDGELWTLRKVLRRLIWHDRIHARAMWRTAAALWGSAVCNPFFFI